MGTVNVLANGTLYLDFRYRNRRVKEYTRLKDSPTNRKRLERILSRIEAEAALDTLGQNYAAYFPNSSKVAEFSQVMARLEVARSGMPSFSDFAEIWFDQMKVEWRPSHTNTVRGTLDKYLIPGFGERALATITKSELLDFRAEISKRRGRGGKTLSAERINHIMTPLRMILNEAADRYGFETPYKGIKSLKVPKTDVQPFTLAEVQLLINSVGPKYTNYLATRFYTALRTSEVDGLQWKYVDFERREIHVCETVVQGVLGDTKTPGSNRVIHMSQVVYDALRRQQAMTGNGRFVFCNDKGRPLNHNNFNQRIWAPLLKRHSLRPRRPYQTRHTAATLWLAAGESPEWIARQMGHTSCEMLFRVYSRWVPNLTRQDGSAFEAFLKQTTTNQESGSEGETE